MKFDKLFKDVRTHLDITQIDFSKKLKTSQALCSKVENGLQLPRADVFVRFARIALCTPSRADLCDLLELHGKK